MSLDEVKSYFSPNKPLELDVLGELQSIMRLHSLSVEDLFFKWESYCIKMGLDTESISLVNVRNLKGSIQDSLERPTMVKKMERKINATPRTGGTDVYGMLDGLVPGTPASGGRLSRTRGEKGMMSSPAGMGDQLKQMNSS